jgi:Gpi18-like mannosyltransferase
VALRPLTRPRLHALVTLPVWARVLVVYLVARIVTTLLIALSSALAPEDGRHGPDPTMLDYISAWDAAWYREIALNGYPDEIPVDGSGHAQQNAWAFMPVYPWLARMLAALVPGAGFGSDDVWAVADAWAVAAALISLVAGFFACWGVHTLLVEALGRVRALWGVAFVAFGPLALMFQVGYAESLFLALIVWALVAIRRESWRSPVRASSRFRSRSRSTGSGGSGIARSGPFAAPRSPTSWRPARSGPSWASPGR